MGVYTYIYIYLCVCCSLKYILCSHFVSPGDCFGDAHIFPVFFLCGEQGAGCLEKFYRMGYSSKQRTGVCLEGYWNAAGGYG